jgi:hypothetical protein
VSILPWSFVMKSLSALLFLAAALFYACADARAQTPQAVAIKVDKDQIDFLVGKELVTSYHIKDSLPRPFFFPLKAPDGTETTRAYPMGKALPGEKPDHPHHRSVWFTYGDVIPEGLELKTKVKGVEGVDFWSETKGHGKIICTKVGDPQVKGADGSIVTHNDWRTTEGTRVLQETRKLGFHNLGKAYLIVFDIDLSASDYPITFGDTKEGAMAIRIHPDITVAGGKGKMQNAEGKINEKQCWGFKSGWCDYSGKIGNSVVGVAIFDDPNNPVASCWHARDYGLMAANPFGREKSKFPGAQGVKALVHLNKGEHLRLRYGVLVHNGDATEGQVAAAFERFVKMREVEK